MMTERRTRNWKAWCVGLAILAAVSCNVWREEAHATPVQECALYTTGAFWMDGTGTTGAVTLPVELPVRITAVFVTFHTGVFTDLARDAFGFFTISVNTSTGSFPVLSTMYRYGQARWVHDPPVSMTPGDTISYSAGGIALVNGAPTTFQGDFGICWEAAP